MNVNKLQGSENVLGIHIYAEYHLTRKYSVAEDEVCLKGKGEKLINICLCTII